jgi:hypothetical protein
MITATRQTHIDPPKADERCDSCSAEAHVLVLLNNGGQLVFCHHHANKNRAALKPIGVLIEHDPGF